MSSNKTNFVIRKLPIMPLLSNIVIPTVKLAFCIRIRIKIKLLRMLSSFFGHSPTAYIQNKTLLTARRQLRGLIATKLEMTSERRNELQAYHPGLVLTCSDESKCAVTKGCLCSD